MRTWSVSACGDPRNYIFILIFCSRSDMVWYACVGGLVFSVVYL